MELLGVEITGDQSLLQQAMVNLVRNALEIMAESPAPPGGHVLTLAAHAKPRRRADAGRSGGGSVGGIELSVSDTGPGVPPEIVERMFNPFFTTRETGTGLGLAIVHRIADAHGGSVRVDRAAGRVGVKFVLFVPAAGRAAPDRSPITPAGTPATLEMAS